MHDEPPDMAELLQHGYRYALALTHDPSQAEDLVHEACVSILRAEGPWHRGYLFATIRHRFIDDCRRRGRTPETPLETSPGIDTLADEASMQQALDAMIEAESITDILNHLRPAEREALYLAAVEQYTASQIAALTGKPRGTVLSLIHRARRKLRECLGECLAPEQRRVAE